MKRVLLVAALLIAGSLSARRAGEPPRRRTADPPSGVLIACGRGTTVGPANCMTLHASDRRRQADHGHGHHRHDAGRVLPADHAGSRRLTRGVLVTVGLRRGRSRRLRCSRSAGRLDRRGGRADLVQVGRTSCGSAPAALMSTCRIRVAVTAVGFINLSFIGSSGGPTNGLVDDGRAADRRRRDLRGSRHRARVHQQLLPAERPLRSTTAPSSTTPPASSSAAAKGRSTTSTIAGNTYGFYGHELRSESRRGHDHPQHRRLLRGQQRIRAGGEHDQRRQHRRRLLRQRSPLPTGRRPSARTTWSARPARTVRPATSCGTAPRFAEPPRRTAARPCRSCRHRPGQARTVTTRSAGRSAAPISANSRCPAPAATSASVQTGATGNPKAGSTPTNGHDHRLRSRCRRARRGQQSVSVFRVSGGDMMYGYGSSISGSRLQDHRRLVQVLRDVAQRGRATSASWASAQRPAMITACSPAR